MMKMNRKAWIHHPVGAIVIGFLVGALAMYLIAKGIIPIAALNPCK
jgi:hypothetical protein